MHNRKKRFAALAMMSLLLIMAALGMTLATLTKPTESRANNFTFGNISIELKEEEWDKLTPEDKIVYPGREIKKDPKITNTGKNDLYAYIEVQVPRAEVRVVADDGSVTQKEWHDLFSFKANSGWELIESHTTADQTYSVYLYAYTDRILAHGDSTETLFYKDKVTYINVLEGELPMDTVLKMPVNAYAIQSGYLNESGTTLKEKMIDAYSKYKDEVKK